MAKHSNNRSKYLGLVGQHNWTETSYIAVEYIPIFRDMFDKKVTIHLEFGNYEGIESAWALAFNEMMETDLYSTPIQVQINGAFNTCRMQAGRNEEISHERTFFIHGYRMDGWGRLRRR